MIHGYRLIIFVNFSGTYKILFTNPIVRCVHIFHDTYRVGNIDYIFKERLEQNLFLCKLIFYKN